MTIMSNGRSAAADVAADVDSAATRPMIETFDPRTGTSLGSVPDLDAAEVAEVVAAMAAGERLTAETTSASWSRGDWAFEPAAFSLAQPFTSPFPAQDGPQPQPWRKGSWGPTDNRHSPPPRQRERPVEK